MDSCLQDGRAHHLLVRLFRTTHRGQSPRQRCLPPRPKNRVESRQHESDECTRSGSVHSARISQGLEIGVNSFVGNLESWAILEWKWLCPARHVVKTMA